MGLRAKFMCMSIREFATGGSQDGKQNTAHELVFNPQYGDGTDNASWSKWTPQGEIKMTVTNPDAVAQFEVGQQYFIDFTPATSIRDRVMEERAGTAG